MYTLRMREVGVRQLRATLTEAVRRAELGERTLVTINGRVVAQLSPVGGDRTAVTLADLVAAGKVLAPARPDRSPSTDRLATWPGLRLDRALSDLRGR